MTLLLLALLAANADAPPGVQDWVQAHDFRTGQVNSRLDRDWTVFDGQYFPASGKTTVKVISPTLGGGGVVYDSMRYDFVYPKDTPAAVRYIRTYQQRSSLNTLSVQNINACLEAVQHQKVPQVKTMLWTTLSSQEGRILKVNCGVTATGAYVTVEEKVVGDTYWK